MHDKSTVKTVRDILTNDYGVVHRSEVSVSVITIIT